MRLIPHLTLALMLLIQTTATMAQTYDPNFRIDVLVMTSFAHDAGDLPLYVTFRGKNYKPNEAAASILPQLGWCSDDQNLRKALAIAWVKQVASVGNRYLNEMSAEAKQTGYSGPKVELLANDTIEVTMPIQHLIGRNPEHEYRPRVFRFSKTGQCDLVPDKAEHPYKFPMNREKGPHIPGLSP
jgi:hypothetical protein